jgi:hypothetical protein
MDFTHLWTSRMSIGTGAPANTQGYGSGRWFPPDQTTADEFDRYSEEFPTQYFRDGSKCVLDRAKMLLTEDTQLDQLATYLRGRIEQGLPTSAIRLSDGEGNILFADEDRYPTLRDYVLAKISHIHFGRGSSVVPANAGLFLNHMREAVAEADVLGVPDHRRIIRVFQRDRHDVDVRAEAGNRKSLITAIQLAEANRLQDKLIANAFFSRQLLPHYPSILRPAKTIVLVTCHPDLVDAIRRTSQVQDVRLIEVPLQSSQMKGTTNHHFPEAYRRICREIPQQPAGAVFLIGAGPLAKYYCTLAKRAGGIAFDVGAVMDFWIGRSGRSKIKKETLEQWSLIPK